MNEKEQTKTIKIKKILLKELGPVLPMGLEVNGELKRNLETKRWTFKEEKKLGELKKDEKGEGMGRYVTKLISSLFKTFAGLDFEKISLEEKILRLSQAWGGDIFYAYCWLRYKTLGNILRLNLKCSRCKKDFIFDVDLGTIEVSYADKIEPFTFDYELEEPFEIRKQKVKGFKIQPPKWNMYEKTTELGEFTKGEGQIKQSLIHNCIYGLIGEEKQIILMQEELDEMTKIDIEKLSSKIDDVNLGPDMSVDAVCSNCKYEFKSMISWGYDNFFGVSSR